VLCKSYVLLTYLLTYLLYRISKELHAHMGVGWSSIPHVKQYWVCELLTARHVPHTTPVLPASCNDYNIHNTTNQTHNSFNLSQLFVSSSLLVSSPVERCHTDDLICQTSLSLAFLQAAWTPKFKDWRSSSTVLSQVVLGRPICRWSKCGGNDMVMILLGSCCT